MTRFDLLNGSDIEFRKLGEALLRHRLTRTLAPYTRAERFKLLLLEL